METASVSKNKIDSALLLLFITSLRRFENKPLSEGYKLIAQAFAKVPNQIDHLCDQWRYKKRSFGSFYLNLDPVGQIRILQQFGITSPGFNGYLHQVSLGEMECLFAPVPPELGGFTSLVKFFCNHSICQHPADFISLDIIPKSKYQCYGNTTHWCNYILSLPYPQQHQLLSAIAMNYEG